MFGALLFYNVYMNLGEECRNKVLRNIFEIDNVSITDLVIRENLVVFRFFGNGVFYQYVFDLSDGNNKYYKVSCSRNIVHYFVSVKTYPSFCEFNLFSLLVDLLLCQDEYEVYQLMRKFL